MTINEEEARQTGIQDLEPDEHERPNEHSPLLPGGSSDSSTSKKDTQNPLQKRGSILYAFIFGIPLLLLLSSIILGTLLLNTHACPPNEVELIANLTNQLDVKQRSLDKCVTNATRLDLLLSDEKQRVTTCRISEKRLAERVDSVEKQLGTCNKEQVSLKQRLEAIEGDLGTCLDAKEKLEKEMETGVHWQFLQLVTSLGPGGDSWVCSDTTPSWLNGYASTVAPHPTIIIKTWMADLTDSQHSTDPLVFPPLDFTTPVRIIGYKVDSQDTSGNNGYWKIANFSHFGIKDTSIEFYALAAHWPTSKARYEVTVYYINDA